MMHVLVVAPHLPPAHVGGVEVYSQYLMRGCSGRGHRVQGAAVERVASGPIEACATISDERDGYTTHRLTITLPPARPFPLLADHAPAQAWFERLLRETMPDVMHVQSGYLLGAPALAAARRTGTPVVLTVHDYWFACPRIMLQHPSGEICSGAERPSKCAWCLTADKRRFRLVDGMTGGSLSRGRDGSRLWRTFIGGPVAAVERRQALLLDLLSVPSVVLAATRFVAAQVASIGYPLDRITLTRYGVPSTPRVAAPRQGHLRLLFIGQVAPHKGIHVLIAAVRALAGRPVTLEIHGPLDPHPGYVSRLRALAGDDPRISFHGTYRRDVLPQLFATADAIVVPSVWHEVAGLVVLEAQGAGLPAIVSALGGLPEVVTDEVDGLLFDPHRDGDLARQIGRLLDEPGLLQRLAAATLQPPSVDDEVDSLLAIYDAVRRPA
jgi:glycosyltransferase involved in cell wall biosynthesis